MTLNDLRWPGSPTTVDGDVTAFRFQFVINLETARCFHTFQ